MPDISRKHLRDRLLQVAHDAQWYGWERAELGILNEDDDQIVAASGRPGWAHVRISRGGGITSTVALCTRVPLTYGLKVWVGVDQDGLLSVMGIREGEIVNEIGAAASQVTVPSVATTGLVSVRRLQPGLASALRVGGSYTMQVYIWPFIYRYNSALVEWPGGFIDLTSHIPSTASTRRLVLIGIDPDTNTATAVDGSDYSFPTTLTATQLIQIDPGDMVPVAGVNLYNGMTSVNSESFFIDARPFVTGTGMNPVSVRKHNVSAVIDPGTGDDELDGYGIGSTWVNTLTGEIWFCVDASEGAAVWTQPTGGSSVESLNDLADVDVLSTPPTDGQALVYDADNALWMPGTVQTYNWYPELAPVSASAYDDEFNANVLDDQWTEFDQYAVVGVSALGPTLALTLHDNADVRSGGVYTALALGLATDFTIVTRLKIDRIVSGAGGLYAAGIVLMEDATDEDALLKICGLFGQESTSPAFRGWGVDTWTQQDEHNSTSYSQYATAADTYYYIRVVRSGGTVYVDLSEDGLTWMRNTPTGAIVDIAHVGLAVAADTPGADFTATFDFFRYFPVAHDQDDFCYGRGISVSGALDDLDDVDVSSSPPTDGQALTYQASSGLWVPGEGGGGGGASAFLDLTDVPETYAAQAGKLVAVTGAEDGLEFTAPASAAVHQAVFTIVGGAEVATHPIKIPNLTGSAKAISSVGLLARTGPTGADLIVNVTVGGVSIWDLSASYAKIVAGQTSGDTSSIDNPAWGTGAANALEVAVTQIGSTVAGADLAIVVVYS